MRGALAERAGQPLHPNRLLPHALTTTTIFSACIQEGPAVRSYLCSTHSPPAGKAARRGAAQRAQQLTVCPRSAASLQPSSAMALRFTGFGPRMTAEQVTSTLACVGVGG